MELEFGLKLGDGVGGFGGFVVEDFFEIEEGVLEIEVGIESAGVEAVEADVAIYD